jgi:hypothetical protein
MTGSYSDLTSAIQLQETVVTLTNRSQQSCDKPGNDIYLVLANWV